MQNYLPTVFPVVIEICEGQHQGQAFHVVIPQDLPINICFKVLKTNVMDIGAFRFSEHPRMERRVGLKDVD